ncbi:MAG: amidohydrolase family protein [Candidatus Omnitrophica bacterium]|nr:amidohydrolase family protein [Candidatus Omnitrophota bacterium]
MLIDCHNHVGVELSAYLRGEFPYGQHLATMVAEGGALGIDRWVVFPMVTYLALDLAALRSGVIHLESPLERVPYAFENRRLLEEVHELFPTEGARVWPFVMVDPERGIEGQVAALRALRQEYRFDGIKLQTTMIQARVKKLLSEGRVFLELAEEWNLPMLIHSSVLPSDVWAQAEDILDIVEQTPKVRFCLAHSCRFDRVSLDRLRSLPNAWFDCSAHGIHCRLAAAEDPNVAQAERRFDSDYTDPERVLRDLAEAYPDKFLWGSDSPYYSFVGRSGGKFFSLRSSYEDETRWLLELPANLRKRVSETNTLAFLGTKP